MALRRYAERGKGLAQRSKATAMRGNQRIAKAVDCTALNGSARVRQGKAEHCYAKAKLRLARHWHSLATPCNSIA